MSRNAPVGEAFNERSGFTSIMAIPIKEKNIPVIFAHVIFSLAVKKAASGVNTGIVAIITELMVGEEYFNPKFSPRK
jgi:hypothetical protein